MAKYREVKGDLVGYDYIANLIEYNPETGGLYWKYLEDSDQLPDLYPKSLEVWNKQKAGKRCETTMPGKKYTRLCVKIYTQNHKRVNFYAHRIAWLLYYGEWPDCYVDHLNGDACDNSIENLREHSLFNNRNIPQKVSKNSVILGVKFNGIKKNGMPSYTAWGRTTGNQRYNPDFTLLTTESLFEAVCARRSWENSVLDKGYTLRHFNRAA